MDSAVEKLASDLRRSNRRSTLVSMVILGAIVISAIAVLAFTFMAVAEANRQLSEVTASLSAVEQALTEKQKALIRANDEISNLESKVTALNTELETKQKALNEAITLGQYTYQLDWGDAKAMFAISEQAAPVLSEILNLRGETHWGMANTVEGGFNSPGFASLVLQKLGKPDLPSLPRDSGPPKPGDIVIYKTGYSMFYFEDQQGKPFVVGMTPFGVTALNYDFGVESTGVVRTGISP